MLLFVSICKLVAEIALLALAGQWVLGLLAGAKRDQNFFYQLLQMMTRPFVKGARMISPKVVIDRHVPLVAFFLLHSCGSGPRSPRSTSAFRSESSNVSDVALCSTWGSSGRPWPGWCLVATRSRAELFDQMLAEFPGDATPWPARPTFSHNKGNRAGALRLFESLWSNYSPGSGRIGSIWVSS
jgi:hypothetical protein